jgi:hypothetical protein
MNSIDPTGAEDEMLSQTFPYLHFSCGLAFTVNTQRRDRICDEVSPFLLAIEDVVCGNMDQGNSSLSTG